MDSTALILAVVALLVGLATGAVAAWLVASSRRRAAVAQDDAARDKELARRDGELARERAEHERTRAAVATAEANARAEVERVRAESVQAQGAIARAESGAREAAAQAAREVAEAHAQVADAQAEVAAVSSQLAAEVLRVKAAQEAVAAAEQRMKKLAEDRDALANQFKVLSQETLDRQGKEVDARAQQRVTETEKLLAPVTEALSKFQERLAEVEKDRTSMSATLKTQMESMVTANAELRKETQVLANALRKPQVRGAWGETQLRNVAQMSGMTPYCDFTEQYSTTTADGDLQRPDMRVNLADGRAIFVDSKAPLSAFLDAMDARDDAERRQREAVYGRQVKQHIEKLGAKSYWTLETDVPSPDFVVLFLPGEGFLMTALEQEPSLYEFALNKGVVLATPSTLIALLRTVAHTWRQTELAADARKVLDASQTLYERLGTMSDHVGKLGKALTSSVDAYNRFVGSLESRVLPTARELYRMNIGTAEVAEPVAVEKAVREVRAPELQPAAEHELLARPEPTTEALVADDAEALTGTVLELKRQA